MSDIGDNNLNTASNVIIFGIFVEQANGEYVFTLTHADSMSAS